MLFCWIKRCVFGVVAWVRRYPLSNAIEGVVTFCTRVERDYEWHVVVPVLVIACVSVNFVPCVCVLHVWAELIASCPLRGFSRRRDIFDSMFVVEHAFRALLSLLGFFMWTLFSLVCHLFVQYHVARTPLSGS